MEARLNTTRIRQAQYIWQVEYFSKLAPVAPAAQPATAPKASAENQQLLNYVSSLDPLMASAFMDYQEIAQQNGLTSNAEKKLVVSTVAELYSVSPTLLPRYFAAITKLARSCGDDYKAYVQALTNIEAKVDAITTPSLGAVSSVRIPPLQVKEVISQLENAF